jgi:lipopolysaccharide/colanic/teichoic acid biosynthesis glycosyltransferase
MNTRNGFAFRELALANGVSHSITIPGTRWRPAYRFISRPVHKIEPLIVPPVPAWKRAMDITFAGMALLLLSPLFLLIALFIKIVDPGPVFFKQTRVGRLGRPFSMWKFRTMKVNAETQSHQNYFHNLMESDQPMTKLDAKNDPRIIPLGRLLRKTGIDELPQIFNVLRGDMSLVGPRPCLPYEYEKYRHWQHNRFDILPGITGLWQVSGKNNTTFKQMIRLDITYSRQLSLKEDLRILFKTIPAIIAQAKGHAA